MRRILIVDDERNVHYSFRRALDRDFEVESAFDGEQALQCLDGEPPDAILLDVRLPGLDGLETLERIRGRHPQVPVVVMTAFGTAETAIRATALAARDYLLKPVDVPALKSLLEEILPAATPSGTGETDSPSTPNLVGRSPRMQELGKLIGRAAGTDTTVLITGETGTGKEVIAHAIHGHGARRLKPLVAVNCAAIPDNLLESEIFGHERGAFTGADTRRPGKFEVADQGTLLLDEVGDMPAALQAKLLRVLQTGEVARLGGAAPQKFDVRVIAVTNADLEARVAEGSFREDLYYRLNVLRIQVPPLRERVEDIMLLAHHVLERERSRLLRPLSGFTREAEERLLSHAWPGNVRELENVIAQACIHARGERITAEDIRVARLEPRSVCSVEAPVEDPETLLDEALAGLMSSFPGEILQKVERAVVAKALIHTGGNQVQAANLLGTTRNVVRNRMHKYSL